MSSSKPYPKVGNLRPEAFETRAEVKEWDFV